MKKEIGRRTLPDGSVRVHYEEPIAGDFGQRQSFETLPPESTSPNSAPKEEGGIAELTPGQALLYISASQLDENTIAVEANFSE